MPQTRTHAIEGMTRRLSLRSPDRTARPGMRPSTSFFPTNRGTGTMTITDRPRGGAASLAWLHAGLFSAIALACYVSPETVFGDSAWLPLARLAVLLLAA